MIKRKCFVILLLIIQCFVFVRSGFASSVVSDKNKEKTGVVAKENKKPFFYYIVNEQCKTNVVIGYGTWKYDLKSTKEKHRQTRFFIESDFLWYPFKGKNYILLTGLNMNVPIRFIRNIEGKEYVEKNFTSGLYLTVTPYIAIGYGFDFKGANGLSVLGTAGFDYDYTKVRLQNGKEEKLRILSVIGVVNVKYHIKQRYSLLFCLKGTLALKGWTKNINSEIKGSSVSFGCGFCYDF